MMMMMMMMRIYFFEALIKITVALAIRDWKIVDTIEKGIDM